MKPFAFVFPGQGSQSVGMLDGWGKHAQVRAVLDEASEALHEDIGQLISQGPKEALALTTNTQPLMLVAGVAAYRVWLAEVGVAPSVVAGHSLGEYSALVAAGVLTLAQAAPLVRFRAQVMQDAVPAGLGAMAAILGLPADQVLAVCQQVTQSFDADAKQLVEAVNFNDPNQTVIAGTKAAVDAACAALKSQGAKRALLLPVSAPFHSSLMRPAALRLKERLAETEFAPPQIDVINNIDVAVETDPQRIRDALVRQACGAVQWVQLVQALRARGLANVVECGPGKVLAGLTGRICPDMLGLAMFDMDSLAKVQAHLLQD